MCVAMSSANIVSRLDEGVAAWNDWRIRNSRETLDFRGIQLDGRNLQGADLRNADFGGALLHDTVLNYARLEGARFHRTDLTNATLVGASVRHTVFGAASLISISASGIDATGAQFHNCKFQRADLREAALWSTRFIECDFDGTSFVDATFGYTQLFGSDLSVARALETTIHRAPSTVDLESLRRSRGRIPAKFAKGCGFTDFEIAVARLWNPDLTDREITDIVYEIDNVRAAQPIQKHAVFISYSHHDKEFVDAFQIRLDAAGIRCWRDVQISLQVA